MSTTFMYIFIGIGAILLLYIIARILSRGIFQSYFETRDLFEKGESNGKKECSEENE